MAKTYHVMVTPRQRRFLELMCSGYVRKGVYPSSEHYKLFMSKFSPQEAAELQRMLMTLVDRESKINNPFRAKENPYEVDL